jgi:YD repeat-containing protein
MKSKYLFLCVTILVTLASCKKKESEGPYSSPSTCYLTQMESNNGILIRYYYDAQNRVIRTATYQESTSEDSIFGEYTYSPNKVTSTTNNGVFDIVQTIHLNSFGFADSALITFGTYGSYQMLWKYNTERQVISYQIFGEIATTEIDQEVYYEYTNGNKTKQTLIDNVSNTTQTSTLEYYLDKPNKAKTFEEQNNYVNSNTNLVKKVISETGTVLNYTYDFDTQGNVTQMKMVSETNEEKWNKYNWSCK